MKVLVTGQRSYAGTQFTQRMADLNKELKIEYVSVRDNAWQEESFSDYDAVYHVAGIVHRKETIKNQELYYKINRDLTYQLALKAKTEGVKSFVFLSTMAVYGVDGKIGEDMIISKETNAFPNSHYGKSKLEAEVLLLGLQSTHFDVSILRVPMIYGPNCPGNYSLLSKLAKKTPVFPRINNRRSMIFINHLSDVVIYIMEKKLSGIFLIKNPDDIGTLEMVRKISTQHHKKIHASITLAFLIKIFGNYFKVTRKMFSSVLYKEVDCKIEGFMYNSLSFEESIILSERNENTD